MGCPDLNTLADFAQGLLPEAARHEIASHLTSGCQPCQSNQTWLTTVSDLTATDQSFDFPEWVIRRIVNQFETNSVTALSQLRQFVAQLVFDSFALNSLAEVRSESGGMANGRQVLYQAEGYDIDLRFEQADDADAEALIGQILSQQPQGTGLAPYSIQLLQGGQAINQTVSNMRGIFKLVHIASGVYDLKISVPEGEINISPLATARAAQ